MNNKIAKILERPMRYLAYQAFASQDDWSNYNIDKESLKWKLIDKDTVRFLSQGPRAVGLGRGK